MAAPSPYVPGEVLVRYRADVTAARRAAFVQDLAVSRLESFPALGVERLAVAGDVPAAVARLAARPEVAYAEPNYLWSIEARPNDPLYSQLYAMRNAGQTGGTPGADVRAELAWNLFTGSPATLVGVIDSGVGGETEFEVTDPATGEAMTGTFGETARIVKIAPDGTQTDVATLPSVFAGQEATGGGRLALVRQVRLRLRDGGSQSRLPGQKTGAILACWLMGVWNGVRRKEPVSRSSPCSAMPAPRPSSSMSAKVLVFRK